MLPELFNGQTFDAKALRRLLVFLVSVELFFVAVYWADYLAGHHFNTVFLMFNLDGEITVPTWFSSMQLFCIAAVFFRLSSAKNGKLADFASFFRLSGISFTFLSVDETAKIHENLNEVLKKFDALPRFNNGHGIWLLIYLGAAVILALFLRRRASGIYKAYPRACRVMAGGAALFVLGAVVLEVIGYQFLADHGQWLYKLEVGVEEFLEMFGVSVILYGALLFCKDA